jgi:hypothetical protein
MIKITNENKELGELGNVEICWSPYLSEKTVVVSEDLADKLGIEKPKKIILA